MNEFHTAFILAHAIPWLTIFAASFLQSITGFGLIMVASPFLLLFYDAKFTILLVLFIALCSNTIQFCLLYKDASRPMVIGLITGSLCGILPGICIYQSISSNTLKLIVGCIILGFLLLRHIVHLVVQQNRRNSILAGALSGLLYMTTGMGGPPLVLYFTYAHLAPKLQRATCVVYFFFGNFLSLGAFLLSGTDIWPAAKEAAVLLPSLAVGLLAGYRIFPYVSAALFQKIILSMLYIACIYTIGSAVFR